MSAWTVGTVLPKQEAIKAIEAKAKEQGFRAGSAIKVSYDGAVVEGPQSLPDQVDMSKIVISNMLNNAACGKKGKKGKKK